MKHAAFGFLILFFSLSTRAQADIEPALKDLISVYSIEDIEGAGQVWIQKSGDSQWNSAKEGQNLEEGDSLKVGLATEVVLSLKKDTFVHVGEKSILSVQQLEEQGEDGFLTRLSLQAGVILSDVRKKLDLSGSAYEVEAGGVVCGVRGTVFEVLKEGDEVEATTHEGTVQVRNASGTQMVQAGETEHCHHGLHHSKGPCAKRALARYKAWKALKTRCLARRSSPHSSHAAPKSRAYHR